MLFTRIPQQYAPLGGELRYAVSQEAAGNIDIRIVDAAAGAADGIGAAVSSGGANSAGKGGPAGDGCISRPQRAGPGFTPPKGGPSRSSSRP